MSDCEEDRLLIDDAHDQSFDDSSAQIETDKETIPEEAVHLSVFNGTSQTEELPREDGEIEDEDAEMSSGNVSKSESDHIVAKPEKRALTPPSKTEASTSKRKKNNPKVDKSTCVHSRAVQSDVDDSIFDMEPGSSFMVQMTVVCKIEGANTVYVSSKWKDQELSGILTDGIPPGFQTFVKKRHQNGSSFSGLSGDNDRSGNQSTPTKKRAPRNVQNVTDSKKKPSKQSSDNGADDADDDIDVGGSNEAGSVVLTEVMSSTSWHECPTEGCFHKYDKSSELDYHINNAHTSRAIMKESLCCQTDISYFKTNSVATETEIQKTEVPPPKSETKVPEGQKGEKQVGSPFSDISGDDSAPHLQKEEPSTDDIRPVALPIEPKVQPAAPSPFVPTVPGNGIFVPGFPVNQLPLFNPTRPIPQEHKIHQLKTESSGDSSSSTSTVVTATPKPLASPAQPRAFNVPMNAQAQAQAAQQMIQYQNQLQMMFMNGRGGPPNFNMPPTSNPDQLAQMASFQATYPGAQFGNMFPK